MSMASSCSHTVGPSWYKVLSRWYRVIYTVRELVSPVLTLGGFTDPSITPCQNLSIQFQDTEVKSLISIVNKK